MITNEMLHVTLVEHIDTTLWRITLTTVGVKCEVLVFEQDLAEYLPNNIAYLNLSPTKLSATKQE